MPLNVRQKKVVILCITFAKVFFFKMTLTFKVDLTTLN